MFEYTIEILEDRIENLDYYFPDELIPEVKKELEQAIELLKEKG